MRFISCLIMEMFSFIFNDLIVKKVSFTVLFQTFMKLSVLNRKQEIENWLNKNANSFVLLLVNCFSPNTSDKATFKK